MNYRVIFDIDGGNPVRFLAVKSLRLDRGKTGVRPMDGGGFIR